MPLHKNTPHLKLGVLAAIVCVLLLVAASRTKFVHELRFSHSGERVTDVSLRRLRAAKRSFFLWCPAGAMAMHKGITIRVARALPSYF